MVHPSLQDFCAAAEKGNLIPVYREILADDETPLSAYAALGGEDHSFLLESVVGGETWAAYSFIGVAPRAVLRWQGGTATVTWSDGEQHTTSSWQVADPTAALAEVMAEWRPVEIAGLPRFWGGAVGWMSYDVVRCFEDLPARARPDLQLPALYMVLTDTLVIFDNLRQTVKVVATAYVPRPDKAERAYQRAVARIDELIDRLRTRVRALRVLDPPPPGEDRSMASAAPPPPSSFSRSEFVAAVDRAKDYVLAGDVFQVVLSQRFAVPRGDVDPLDVYRALRVINPSPYMFHLEFPEAQVTGASPETLVRLSGGKVEVRPIAGTRPRGLTPGDDARLAEELVADAKERAEHLMLIDLGRNDVGRVATVGSVQVTEQMAVERFSHVMHMTSHVEGELAAGRTWHDVLRATFPAGTLTGAPKIRAMEIIDELEPHQRGIYGGAVGYVSYSGNMDLAIAIRTLVTVEDTVYVQAGAGVVADSDPEAEWQETVNKARAVLRALEMARTASEPRT
jgi:anthranilate synthase component 1